MSQKTSVTIPPVNVERISVSDFFACDVNHLIDEYRKECANEAFGVAPPSRHYYESLEKQGMLFPAVAKTSEGKVVGFVVVVVYAVPHFDGKTMATIESIFLSKDYRKGRSGVSLIRWAQQTALVKGAVGVYISAPVGSRLEKLASLIATKTNSVFFLGA